MPEVRQAEHRVRREQVAVPPLRQQVRLQGGVAYLPVADECEHPGQLAV